MRICLMVFSVLVFSTAAIVFNGIQFAEEARPSLECKTCKKHPTGEDNLPPQVNELNLSLTEVILGCASGKSASGSCPDRPRVDVKTKAVDPENDPIIYNYTVSGGRIVGSGANVTWDLTGTRPGEYVIIAGVDDGCGICEKGTKKETITVKSCPDCVE